MLLVTDKIIMFQLEWWQEKWTWNDDDIFKINSNFQTLQWPFICTISKLSHDKRNLSIPFIYEKKKDLKSWNNKPKAIQGSVDSEAGNHSSISNWRPSQASSLVL